MTRWSPRSRQSETGVRYRYLRSLPGGLQVVRGSSGSLASPGKFDRRLDGRNDPCSCRVAQPLRLPSWNVALLPDWFLTMATHARHPKSDRTKHPNVLDPVQGHGAGAGRAQSSLGSGLPVQAAQNGPSWKARPRLSRPSNRRVHPRVLLARPRMPEGKDSRAEPEVLARQVRSEQDSGSAKRAATPARGLVSVDRVGMLARHYKSAGRLYPQATTRIGEKKGARPLGEQVWTAGQASIHSGGADTLVSSAGRIPAMSRVARIHVPSAVCRPNTSRAFSWTT